MKEVCLRLTNALTEGQLVSAGRSGPHTVTADDVVVQQTGILNGLRAWAVPFCASPDYDVEMRDATSNVTLGDTIALWASQLTDADRRLILKYVGRGYDGLPRGEDRRSFATLQGKFNLFMRVAKAVRMPTAVFNESADGQVSLDDFFSYVAYMDSVSHDLIQAIEEGRDRLPSRHE